MAGLKKTGVELDLIFDDRPRKLPENNMRGSLAPVMGSRYVKRSETKK